MVFTKKDQNTISYFIRVYSRDATDYVGNTQMFVIKIKKDDSLVVTIPRFREISVFTMMRALGLETDEDIINVIVDKNDKNIRNQLLIAMNNPSVPTLTREQAMEVLIKNMVSSKTFNDVDEEIEREQKKLQLIKILTKEILPHVHSKSGDPELDMLHKAYYIGYMVKKLLKCYISGINDNEELSCDDRDSLFNKRVEVAGTLLGTLFEQFFKKMLGELSKTLKINKNMNVDDINRPLNIINHIKPNAIEQGLRQAVTMGNFTQNRKGISQKLDRLNFLHTLSYTRRIITPSANSKNNKATSLRHLHNTQYATFCPLETPEGNNTGLLKNLALMTNITINMNEQIPIIETFLEPYLISIEDIDNRKLHRYFKVFMNNNWIGFIKNNKIIEAHNFLKKMRSDNEIDNQLFCIIKIVNWQYILKKVDILDHI